MTAARRVCVDLDYVLARPDGANIGEPYEGARFFLRMLKAMKYEVVILTARIDPVVPTEAQTNMVRWWLDRHEMPYDWICGKPDAIAYFDDRAFGLGPHPTVLNFDDAVKQAERMYHVTHS